jgi:hypothetical protein
MRRLTSSPDENVGGSHDLVADDVCGVSPHRFRMSWRTVFLLVFLLVSGFVNRCISIRSATKGDARWWADGSVRVVAVAVVLLAAIHISERRIPVIY